MRCLTIVVLLLTVTVTCCSPGPSVTAEPTAPPPEDEGLEHKPAATPEAPTLTPTSVDTMTPTPAPSQEPTPEGPLLRMVIIKARSSREVKQLRQMHLVDIVRVRPDPSRPPSEEELLSGGFIVEAVVSRGMLAKLKAMGFEVSEVPPPEK
jgi:hypothetical protein